MSATAKIILLNGSSSSGKTTLALKLQQLLDEPFQHMALDQFRDGLPGRYRGFNSPEDTPGAQGLNIVPVQRGGEAMTEIQFGAHGSQVLAGMRRAVAAFAAAGNNVIIDDLLFEPEMLTDYVDALDGFAVWFVGVRCSLEVVNAREASRIGRFPGTAEAHFHEVHAHGAAYDVEVDTSDARPRACAEQIIRRMETAPEAFARLRTRG